MIMSRSPLLTRKYWIVFFFLVWNSSSVHIYDLTIKDQIHELRFGSRKLNLLTIKPEDSNNLFVSGQLQYEITGVLMRKSDQWGSIMLSMKHLSITGKRRYKLNIMKLIRVKYTYIIGFRVTGVQSLNIYQCYRKF